MGISEHLERHPEEELNLSDLALEEESREFIFDPEEEISTEDWEKMKQELETLRIDNNWTYFSNLVASLKIIFPERINELNLNDQAFQRMQQKLERVRGNNDWQFFSSLAMNLKILFPDRVDELDLDDQDFQGVKQRLEKCRGKNWSIFSFQAVCLKILSAKEIKITDKGLELVMPEKKKFKKEKEPGRPERKQL